MSWQPEFEHGRRPDARSRVFAFDPGGRLLVVGEPPQVPPLADLPSGLLDGAHPIYLGRLDGEPCFACAVAAVPDGLEPRGLRDLFASLPDELAAVAGRAAQAVEWDLAHRFCGRCGTPTAVAETELARVCPGCGASSYPRITPAVIMLVTRGDRMLLARREGSAFFSCLAGFVEPGETLEQAVAREVLEEVGVEVEAIRYIASQPWPFPSQLMIGFTAEATAGELAVDPAELAEAAWFARDEAPQLPPPFTIARQLIDSFLAE